MKRALLTARPERSRLWLLVGHLAQTMAALFTYALFYWRLPSSLAALPNVALYAAMAAGWTLGAIVGLFSLLWLHRQISWVLLLISGFISALSCVSAAVVLVLFAGVLLMPGVDIHP